MAKKKQPKTSQEIRQTYLDYFAERGHTIVPSASLVPGGDQTLLFTNAGMVQFKDVFLGLGSRPYTRAVDTQKCMRVAGKHNDLDDVGRDDTHHTFFEMLGNWSFGDYYKEEAITWAWDLLTEVYELPKDKLWATVFEDELGQIPRDDEAAEIWNQQPGFDHDHLLFFGRKENFWEMAETGPCGPDSEIHLDRGPEYCNMQDVKGHECAVNGECQRFLELWNLVFIQYNRLDENTLEPLPAKHVDTGMGFARLVSVIQDVDSNYKTDLFTPILGTIQELAGDSEEEMQANLTPYRVIADHARAAAFLIADGVVPGNMGRNYVCRMIVRRASRFGGKLGLNEPFMARVAQAVIDHYGGFFSELKDNQEAIRQTLTEEERRFQRTLEAGIAHLSNVIDKTKKAGSDRISGVDAVDLYTTHGLPLELTRDIAREHGLEVDETGFQVKMEEHRLASGAGQEGGAQADFDPAPYLEVQSSLERSGGLPGGRVEGDPYSGLESEGPVLAMIVNGEPIQEAQKDQIVDVVVPFTHFYVEAGGQVADSGTIVSVKEPRWEIEVEMAFEPVGGLIVHRGRVMKGKPRKGDIALTTVHRDRRWDVMRNHTATHLLQAALRQILGSGARQSGSLVAPDRFRFDFTHNQPMTLDEIQQVERLVNEAILANYPLEFIHKPLEEAKQEGAMALFGETYGDTVRTVRIGREERISYELCGGTHVPETGVIGTFLVTSEGSVAAGVRRIEAVTGRGAYELVRSRLSGLHQAASKLGVSQDNIVERLEALQQERDELLETIENIRHGTAQAVFKGLEATEIKGVSVLSGQVPASDADTLRQLSDQFREKHPSSVIVLGSVKDGKPMLIAAVSDDLVGKGLHAGELVKYVAAQIGGGGGGKATMAQAGGNDPSKLQQALDSVPDWVKEKLD